MKTTTSLALALAFLVPDPRPVSKIQMDYAAAYAKRDHAARQELVRELADRPDDKGLDTLCWIACNDPDADVQIEAIRSLAPWIEEKKVRGALLDAVFAGHMPVRNTSGLFKDRTRGGGLIPTLRREAAALLRESDDAVKFAAAVLDRKKPAKDDPPDTVLPWRRAAAAEFLGEVGGESAVEALRRHREDPDVRLAVARALGFTYHPAALTALQSWPRHDDERLAWEIRRAIDRIERWEKEADPGDGEAGTALTAAPPDEAYRDKDAPPVFEAAVLVDVGPGMADLMPSVARIVDLELRKERETQPVRVTVLTMRDGERGPELTRRLPMVESIEAAVESVRSIEIEQPQGAVRFRDLQALEAAQRAVAHRLDWSRNSEKRILVFTAARRFDEGDFSVIMADDLRTHESARVDLFHVETMEPLPSQLAAVAKAGGGRSERLLNRVVASVTALIRGDRIDEETVRGLFGVKRVSLVTKATRTVEATFENVAALDTDALLRIRSTPRAGVIEILYLTPDLHASTSHTHAVTLPLKSAEQTLAARATERFMSMAGVLSISIGAPGEH